MTRILVRYSVVRRTGYVLVVTTNHPLSSPSGTRNPSLRCIFYSSHRGVTVQGSRVSVTDLQRNHSVHPAFLYRVGRPIRSPRFHRYGCRHSVPPRQLDGSFSTRGRREVTTPHSQPLNPDDTGRTIGTLFHRLRHRLWSLVGPLG